MTTIEGRTLIVTLPSDAPEMPRAIVLSMAGASLKYDDELWDLEGEYRAKVISPALTKEVEARDAYREAVSLRQKAERLEAEAKKASAAAKVIRSRAHIYEGRLRYLKSELAKTADWEIKEK